MGLKIVKNNLGVIDIIFSCILAFFFISSPYFISTGQFEFTGTGFIKMLLQFAVFLVLAAVVQWMLARKPGTNNKFEALLRHKNGTLLMSLIMLLFWLPVLIALCPGTVINDTWGQFSQYVYAFSGEKVQFQYLYDHHPVVDTFIMGNIIISLASITGDSHVAFFIYVLIQAFLTCLAFSFSVRYAWKTLKVGAGFSFAMFLIYCLLPIFPMSAQLISKDALAAWIFVFFTVMFMELVRTKGQYLDAAFNRYTFFLVCWACCVSRKVGLYVTVISLIICAVTAVYHKKRLLIYAVSILVLFNAVWPAVMNVTGINPGGKKEMLALPFQMTARYVKEYPDDVTEEEAQAIDQLLVMYNLAERYDPVSADPVKGFEFYEKHTSEEYVNYIKTWAAQGIRHPDSYINAILAMESGWFSWTKYFPLANMDWHNQLNTNIFSEAVTVRDGIFGTLAAKYQGFCDALYEIPLVKLLFSYGLYASLIPAFVISTLFLKVKKNGIHGWVAAMPMFFSLALGCWLAPVSIHFEGRRYLFPITYTALIMIAWCRYWMRPEAEEVAVEEITVNGTSSSADSVL